MGGIVEEQLPKCVNPMGYVDAVRERCRSLYNEKNPEKVLEVDALCAKYSGQEKEMYARICTKYGSSVYPLPERAKTMPLPPGYKAPVRAFAKKASAPPPPSAPRSKASAPVVTQTNAELMARFMNL